MLDFLPQVGRYVPETKRELGRNLRKTLCEVRIIPAFREYGSLCHCDRLMFISTTHLTEANLTTSETTKSARPAQEMTFLPVMPTTKGIDDYVESACCASPSRS